MQEFKHSTERTKATLIYEQNQETLSRMKKDVESMNLAGFELESRFENIKRKSPCPCGSGKKFKNCCGE